MKSHKHRLLIVCVGAAVLIPAASAAQPTQPEPASVRRPYRGLFAPPADPRLGRQSLDLSFSVFGAYDDDVYADKEGGTTILDPAYRNSGWFTGATAGLSYMNPGDRASFGAGAGVGLNYYPEQESRTTSYLTRADLGLRIAQRTQLVVGGSFAYLPEYRLGLFVSPTSLTGTADPFQTIAPDLDIYRLNAYRTQAQVSLSQGLGRRSSIGAWYAYAIANREDDRFDYRAQDAGARYLYQMTQHAAVRLGYSYSSARYVNESSFRPQRLHNIDVGVDYSRPLSFSRRTTLSFSTGSAVVARDDLSLPQTNTDFSFRVIGSASLTHEIGRTWTAQAGYRRGVDFHEGFNEPFLSDAFGASLAGLLSRRVSFSSGADYAFGKVGIGTDNTYDSVSANAGVEYALNRAMALYGRYVYYRYGFDADVSLDPRFVTALDRHGVRFGLSVSFPLVR